MKQSEEGLPEYREVCRLFAAAWYAEGSEEIGDLRQRHLIQDQLAKPVLRKAPG